MELTLRNSVKTALVLVVGYVLGLLSLGLFRGDGHLLGAAPHGDRVSLSKAECAPTSDKDSILFLTCGGIY